MTTLKVFIPDSSYVWLAGEIKTIDKNDEDIDFLIIDDFYNDDCKVKSINLRKILEPLGLQSFPLYNEDMPIQGVNDMCSLGYLHEASILDNLNRRFQAKLPYTYAGNICVAINPYQWLDIYTEYLQSKHIQYFRNELDPHVYATSADAYRGIRDHNKNQSILISGESGAGKTETVKILMNHIALIASNKENNHIIDKILQANPLLESFGNAKTIRNDNSSRFGKFIELQFNNNNILIGSKCITYLLEKTRIISVNSNERNYHIFYQLLSAPKDILSKLSLDNVKANNFNYLLHGDLDTKSIENVDDSTRYLNTIQTLANLNINDYVINKLLQTLTAILFIGQIKFIHQDDHILIDESNDFIKCCNYLELNIDILKKCLLTRTIEIKSNKTFINLSIDQAINSKDTLAKEIYYRIFQWLVYIINYNTGTSNEIDNHSKRQNGNYKRNVNGLTVGNNQENKIIGLLDIFGFESFDNNYYEQLLINYTNEKLQQLFISNVLSNIQQEYIDEGLPWSMIDISNVDNSTIINIIDNNKLSIITLLNEECLLPKGLDSSLINKIDSKLCKTYPNYIKKDKYNKNIFTIKHYAGKVSYNITGFIERNKDNIPNDLIELMTTSKNIFISTLFNKLGYNIYGNNPTVSIESDNLSDTLTKSLLLLNINNELDINGNFKIKSSDNRYMVDNSNGRSNYLSSESVSSKFKGQLNKLIEKISKTQVLYVRCIKPNKIKSNEEFDRLMVVEQLRSAGMIEAIEISRAAFPNHLTHSDFIKRFQMLYNNYNKLKSQDSKSACTDLITELINQINKSLSSDINISYAIGKTKVYFGKSLLESIEKYRGKYITNKIIIIQSYYKCYHYRKKYKKIIKFIIKLQSLVLKYIHRKKYLIILKSINIVQKNYRIFIMKKYNQIKKINKSVLVIQKWYRMLICKRQYRMILNKLIKIQSYMKMTIQRKNYIKLRDKYREDCQIRNKLSITESQLLEERNINKQLQLENEQLKLQLLQEKTLSNNNSNLINEINKLKNIIKQLKNEIKNLNEEINYYKIRNNNVKVVTEVVDKSNKSSPISTSSSSYLSTESSTISNNSPEYNKELLELHEAIKLKIESVEGFPATIYLIAPIEKHLIPRNITLHKTIDKNDQCRIECAFANIQFKRLRFLLNDLIDIEINQIIDVKDIKVDRNCCIRFVVNNKGYLNLSFPNEVIRDTIVSIFKSWIDNKYNDDFIENNNVNDSLDRNKNTCSPISPSLSSTWRIVHSPTISNINELDIIRKEYLYIDNYKTSTSLLTTTKMKIFLSLDYKYKLLLIGNNNIYLNGYPSQIKQTITLTKDMKCKQVTKYWFVSHNIHQLELLQNNELIIRFTFDLEDSMLLWEKDINDTINSIE